ncbi:MAG: exosortase/archaeosortase family protein [Planctomycetia bacterium]|nr:exosortase/archaeosortase family protein [Planctomycetia bacterium]
MRAVGIETMAIRQSKRRRASRDAQQRREVFARERAVAPPRPSSVSEPGALVSPALGLHGLDWIVAALVVGATFFCSFWRTLVALVGDWQRQADYSHGFLVAPLALVVLWLRRDRFPRDFRRPGWLGLGLVLMSVAVAAVGLRYFLAPLAGWSMILWIGGVCWVLGGRRVFVWALPAIVFLFFMVPLPYRTEHLFSGPLQRVATIISSWILQAFGLPAVAAGNTIYLGDHQLEVEQACSGLRTMVGIAALVYVFVITTRRSWWIRALLVLFAAPVALLANSLRIVATGLLFHFVSDPASRLFSHDLAGWFTIPVAAALLGGVLWLLGRLLVEVEPAAGPELLGRSQAS